MEDSATPQCPTIGIESMFVGISTNLSLFSFEETLILAHHPLLYSVAR
jgi:hypothetical protein